MEKILPPKYCPACRHKLAWVKDLLFCMNRECPARVLKQLEHHCKVLKIKGAGPKVLEKLNVASLKELYTLSGEEWAERLGSVKIANKILMEIEIKQKSQLPLSLFLASLGIPKFGVSLCKKIAESIEKMEDLRNPSIVENMSLGPVQKETLKEWLNTDKNFEDALYISHMFNLGNYKSPNQKFVGKVCVTGKIPGYRNRDAIAKFLENWGFVVTSTVSKSTTFVISGNGATSTSAKANKARSLNIPIVTFNEFKRLNRIED